jgi:hypothetical protein
MKEKLYTIPLTDAFHANDECPFCYIERQLEQNALDYTLGHSSSYMQSDTRKKTDEFGFCRKHFKQMYQYGNTLGNALILDTYMKKFNEEFSKACKQYSPPHTQLFTKIATGKDAVSTFLEKKQSTCYICDYIEKTYKRYLATFFHLLKHEDSFFDLVKESKGFCMEHLIDLLAAAPLYLNEKEQMKFIPTLIELSKKNLLRVEGDVSWLIDKFDYRNIDADWKNSKNALPRGMQKLAGGYPADKIYINK